MSTEIPSLDTRDASIRLHLQLSFIINLAKSSLVPSQVMIHLGADIDTFAGGGGGDAHYGQGPGDFPR